jgi:hypothetical protein
MTTGNIQELVKALVAAIAEAGPSTGLQGSRAGLVLRRIDPSFNPRDYGVKSLTEFIDKYAPQVVPLRRDPDWVYGLKDWNAPDVGAIDFWRVWVSPSSRAKLLINETDGAVSAAMKDDPDPPGRMVLLPADGDFHRRIARTFADSLADVSEPVQESLRVITEQAGSEWWRAWSRELHRISNEVAAKWRRYRAAALATELRARLEKSLQATAAGAAFRSITGNRRDLALDHAAPQRSAHDKAVTAPQLAGVQDSSLADLVTRVVQRMSTDELRRLPLPVGVVLDVLAKRG